MTNNFDLILFANKPDLIKAALDSGISSFIVDLEKSAKQERQSTCDTMISTDTWQDLENIKKIKHACVICRIDNTEFLLNKNARQAYELGADEIFIPMVRKVSQVEQVLSALPSNFPVSILIETLDALEILTELNKLPLKRYYVGLNDLAIEKKHPRNIFKSLTDGTIDQVREKITKPLGFAGLTDPEKGNPIPAKYIINELARNKATFSFLRRSFFRDCPVNSWKENISKITLALREAFSRSSQQLESNHQSFCTQVRNCPKIT